MYKARRQCQWTSTSIGVEADSQSTAKHTDRKDVQNAGRPKAGREADISSSTSSNITTPLAQVCPGYRRLSGEDSYRNSPIAGGQVVRTPGNDIVAVEALVLDALISQKLGKTASCGYGTALATIVLVQSLTHGAGLADEAQQLVVRQIHSLQQIHKQASHVESMIGNVLGSLTV